MGCSSHTPTINNNEGKKPTEDKEKKEENKNLKECPVPEIKQSIVEEEKKPKEILNEAKEDEAYKKRGRKGLTILENVKEFLPETITRDELKNMVYNCIGDSIVPKSEYVKGKNLTKDQVEGIIDIVYKTVTDEDDNEEMDYDDPRLHDVKVKIGFYDADKENIRKFFFRGKNPTDEEVETMLKNICGGNENTKLLALDLEDK